MRHDGQNVWRHLVAPLCGLVIIGYVIVQADVAAQTLGLVWLVLGVVVLMALYASGRRPELAGMGHDATGDERRTRL